jgi:NAD(P)H-hydrate epimerase
MEQYAVKFAKAHRCIVVLKSHRTVVAMPDGEVYESRLGNAGLAKGGSGDVLAGMIASFAAQGYTPADAALLGVWLHGMSAQLLSQKDTMTAMLPRDLPAMAMQVLHSIPKQGI